MLYLLRSTENVPIWFTTSSTKIINIFHRGYIVPLLIIKCVLTLASMILHSLAQHTLFNTSNPVSKTVKSLARLTLAISLTITSANTLSRHIPVGVRLGPAPTLGVVNVSAWHAPSLLLVSVDNRHKAVVSRLRSMFNHMKNLWSWSGKDISTQACFTPVWLWAKLFRSPNVKSSSFRSGLT